MSAMGLHPKNEAAGTDSISSSLYSLSFAGFLSSKDRQPNSSPIKAAEKKIRKRDQEFEFAPISRHSSASDPSKVLPHRNLVRPKQSQVASQPRLELDDRRSLSVRNNSIRRGGRPIRDEEDEPRSGWRSVFWSFVSPCRECRASKPTVIDQANVKQRA